MPLSRFDAILCTLLATGPTLGAGCSPADGPRPPERAGEARSASNTDEVCLTIQRGLSGSVADAHIADDKPGNNWGASNSLSAGSVPPGLRYALLHFDTGAIPRD